MSHDIYHFVCHPYYLRSVTDHITFTFVLIYIFLFPDLNFIIFILHGYFFVVVFKYKFTAFNILHNTDVYILLLNHSFSLVGKLM